jgi:hypothetical protein
VGPNTGDDPALPIENTVESVRQAYSLGARVVEVDVQLTRDNRLAVFHDDFLSDFTCVHSLTLDQLQQRLPFVPELHQILEVARQFNHKAEDDLGGILIVELMDIDGLQLLTSAQITALTGFPVTVIDKKNSLGLTWANIGPIFRLPGYASAQQFLATGMALSVRVVGGEMDFLGAAEQQQPGSGAAFVAAAHSLGLRAFADPANSEADWNFFASLGVDAIYSTIPLGVRLQPAIPEE